MARVEVTVWRYELPSINGEGWGSFMLDSTGMFAAVTDYGNYAFRWGRHGERDFRKFIADAGLSQGYMLSKLAPSGGREYKGDETAENIKSAIIRRRWNRYLSEEQAREEWELVESCELDYKEGFHDWRNQTKLDDAHEYSVYDYTIHEKAFVEELLPRLAAEIQAELAEETQVATA
ncbi:hypothetical protein [Brevibacillus sp. HD3.3A]|uniref:hypothetical protein n=1 Tax=Brevibacillus sp. HD3.3A TaxID=2738979 RepID=UPI00156A9D90|nr:hypothetical protein [Brevibacillus sp. HD3.3A]UED70749.1 hypothetical protein HP435_08960 [Brevibacillus sp. HD3.3A]